MYLMLVLLSACSSGSGEAVVPVVAADPQSPYANTLAACARESGEQRSCRLADLPLLGMQTAAPDKAAVMARVATTHPWMAQRFSQLLDVLPADVLGLTRSINAIIIGSDIRPSFYWRHTGAIYLDPAVLWLTVAEKRTIDPLPDYRAGFGSGLQFDLISRYVKDNQYAWFGYSLEDESERRLDDIVLPVARLLLHELAHAGDFFPQQWLAGLDPQWTVAQAAERLERDQRQLSQQLTAASPLHSDLYFDLAEVRFLGRESTPQQRALQAGDAVDSFRGDGANDGYNYVSRFEDVAMLFEETAMALLFDVQRDVAISARPAPDEPHIVEWGQRNRIYVDGVRARAQLVTQALLPQAGVAGFFATAAAPVALRSGQSWNDNLNPQSKTKHAQPGLFQPNPRDEVRY